MDTKVKINNTLNPKLWDYTIEKRKYGHVQYQLKPEVRDKLLQIAHEFIKFLDIPKLAVKDYRIVGSSANFNYTEYSDIDLHLVVDFDVVHKDCPIVQGYLYAQKSLFNKEHDISIYGIPVEVYAESTEDKTESNGVWSLKYDGWVQQPTKLKVDIDDVAVKSKFQELRKAIINTKSQDEAQIILDKVYRLRKAGLADAGEFSVENIVFKKLRDNNLIKRLKENIRTAFDKKLSLKEDCEDKKKALVRFIAQSAIVECLTR